MIHSLIFSALAIKDRFRLSTSHSGLFLCRRRFHVFLKVSFHISSNSSIPVSRRSTKSVKVINGRKVVTTKLIIKAFPNDKDKKNMCLFSFILRIEENGQTIEIVEEDGQTISKRINGKMQPIE